LVTKLSQIQTNSVFTSEQVDIALELIKQYETLLNAEQRKFSVGESSVFLLNSREQKYLESKMNAIFLQQQMEFNKVSFLYESMQFYQNDIQ